LFENNKVEEAYKLILNRLDVNWDGALLEDEKRQAHRTFLATVGVERP
jgi:hypothetical protein